MNMRQRLLAGAAVMLLTTGSAWSAASSTGCLNSGGRAAGCGGVAQAPEIDAASGISAIALLTGVLLLVGERTRSKRSSKSDE